MNAEHYRKFQQNFKFFNLLKMRYKFMYITGHQIYRISSYMHNTALNVFKKPKTVFSFSSQYIMRNFAFLKKIHFTLHTLLSDILLNCLPAIFQL